MTRSPWTQWRLFDVATPQKREVPRSRFDFGYCSVMGDRLECTDVWQQHHDRVTAEIPVVVVSDDERLDMFLDASEPDDDRGVVAELRTAVLPEGDECVIMEST